MDAPQDDRQQRSPEETEEQGTKEESPAGREEKYVSPLLGKIVDGEFVPLWYKG